MIGGYTAPQGSRTDLGALLLGYYEDGAPALRGQGRHRVHPRHPRTSWPGGSRRCARTSRRSPTRVRERGATWVRPELVAQVGFTEWTRDGRLRHPRFLGLRDDKAAREVVRE